MSARATEVRALVSESHWEAVQRASDLTGARASLLESGSAASDIVAMPTDLAILDPSMLSASDWEGLCGWFSRYPSFGTYFLLAGVSPHAAVLPKTRTIIEPISVEGVTRAIRRVEAMTSILSRSLSYDELLVSVSDRIEEVGRFEEFLRNETSWLTAPASTRFHLARGGGLVEHSMNVANTMLKLRTVLAPEVSEESCVITGLYHDVGKIGMPGKPYYLPNPSEWHVRNRGIAYIVNDDLVHMDIATRSLLLVSRCLELTEEEAQAVRYHDGQYIEENHSVAHREVKLTRLLQYADNWSGGVLEAR